MLRLKRQFFGKIYYPLPTNLRSVDSLEGFRCCINSILYGFIVRFFFANCSSDGLSCYTIWTLWLRGKMFSNWCEWYIVYMMVAYTHSLSKQRYFLLSILDEYVVELIYPPKIPVLLTRYSIWFTNKVFETLFLFFFSKLFTAWVGNSPHICQLASNG